MAVDIGKAGRRRAQTESPGEERGHLTASHSLVGTETVIGGRVASPGHARRRQLLDVRLMNRAVVVGERPDRPVVASKPIRPESQGVEVDLVVDRRFVPAVVHVEPEAVDIEMPFVGPTKGDSVP
ncbi:MAG TPA: hypothetical protein VHL52_02110 [Acidimicrobiia bacterium]|nr:hypothetical protein [Acidimicrobiia bacterium]